MGFLAEHHIARADLRAAVAGSFMRANDEIADPITIDIPRARHRMAAVAIDAHAVDDKAVAAIKTVQLNLGAKVIHQRAVIIRDPGPTEHDIGFASITAIGGCSPRPDNEIVNAITIDITRTGYRPTAFVTRIDTVYDKACAAVCIVVGQIGKVKFIALIKSERLTIFYIPTEHDIGFASITAIGISQSRPDKEIINAITIDITGARYRISALVFLIDTADDKATGAIATCQTGKIKTGPEITDIRSAFPKYNIGFARAIAIGISQWRADDQIIDAITIDITRAGH